MKKTLIISGIVLVTLLLLFFVYILFFGTPKSVDDIFTSFTSGGDAPIIDETPLSPIDNLPDEPNLLSFGDGPFHKLSSRPVAGMGFVGTTTLRYAELGTGYVYEIDIVNRTENLVSGTTFQRVRSAQFSPDAQSVIFELEGNREMQTLVGSFVKNNDGETILDPVLLPEGAHDADFTDNSTVSYLLTVREGTEVHQYQKTEEVDTLILTLPQQKLHAAWPIYVYTTPAAQLSGYIYDISNGSVQYVLPGSLGLTAHAYDEGVVITGTDNDGNMSSLAAQDGFGYDLPFTVFPEKCVSTQQATSTLVCAVDENTIEDITFPDDWYKGIESFQDMFYAITVEEGGGVSLFSPADYTRDFDVLSIKTNVSGNIYLFIDKYDNGLWMFETSFTR